jgi:small GTP-binding protein
MLECISKTQSEVRTVQRIKIVVTGPEATGKSTFIQSFAIPEKQALSIEHEGKTVALDFAHRTISGIDVFVFGTPGLRNFEFMRTILMKGAQGLLVLFDSTKPETFKSALSMTTRLLNELNNKIPVVFVANKQDLPDAVDVSYFSLVADNSFPIVGASAKTGEGVEQAVALLLNMTVKCVPVV